MLPNSFKVQVITCCLAKTFLENRLTPSKEIKKHAGPLTFASYATKPFSQFKVYKTNGSN
jgi:hypothetical protein